MVFEIRDQKLAEKWLSAGLCLFRLNKDLVFLKSFALTELSMPPAGVIGDMAKIILKAGGSLNFIGEEIANKDLNQAIRLYEDNFLGLLAQDPRIESASNAIARLPKEMQNEAVALLISRILKKIEFANGVHISPSIIRRFVASPEEDIVQKGLNALHQADISTFILDAYKDLVFRARRTGTLLAETDIFVLENLELLPNLSQRMAIEQIVEASEEFNKFLPRKTKPKSKRMGPTPTNIDNEDNYPIGGFSSISTAGSIENLVTSELIYMDQGKDEVDLFDMRYVEGELLYYTRDESVFVRQRHQITFVFMPDLIQARFKDQNMRWQRFVVALGFLLVAVQKLSFWLSEEGLEFRVCFIKSSSKSLSREKDLTTILLREWINKNMAKVIEVDNLKEIISFVNSDATFASTDLITFGMDKFINEDEIDQRAQKIDISLAKKETIMKFKRNEITGNTPWDAWKQIGQDLLLNVV